MAAHDIKVTDEQVATAFKTANGSVSETARMLGIARSTVRDHISKVGLGKKPIAKGSTHRTKTAKADLPSVGSIKRYICTSAQNNTYIHKGVWRNLLALAKHYDADILVGTFSYDLNSYGPLAVKKDSWHGKDSSRIPWYDPEIKEYIDDNRVQLGKGLVWCGEVNIIPTAKDPLAGFESYAHRNSAIFPHAKISMRSIAAVQGSGAKLTYTTGTVTKRNYIKKRAGLVAEFHHTYGALIVEVDSEGVWKVRQLDAEDVSGTIYDLTLKVENGVVTDGHRVEAINWGDIHATIVDPTVLSLSATAKNNMLDVLKPKFQFIHDLIEGASVNHHGERSPLERFKTSLRGLSVVHEELKRSAIILSLYHRADTQMVVVNSNHDRWLDRWLDNYDPRVDDARNAELYYDGNAARYRSARTRADLNVLEYLMRQHAGLTIPAKFLALDESFLICDKKIECGMHGDFGPNGAKGSPVALARVGRRANVGHTHTAGIYDGLYVAGTSTTFRMGYNHGPSGWTHSHVITYENGKRAIITMFQFAWRAEQK
jgi:hypothetical protein